MPCRPKPFILFLAPALTSIKTIFLHELEKSSREVLSVDEALSLRSCEIKLDIYIGAHVEGARKTRIRYRRSVVSRVAALGYTFMRFCKKRARDKDLIID